MLKILSNYFVLSILCLFTIGCSSLICRNQGSCADIYPGVRRDFGDPPSDSEFLKMPVLDGIYTIIDLPFSFVVDTIWLPFDLLIAGIERSERKAEMEKSKEESQCPALK